MRKVIISLILISLLAIVCIVINKAVNTNVEVEEKTTTTTKSKKLPLFEFFTLDSIVYSKYNLKKNKSIILVYFDPDCGLCEKSGEVFSTFKKVHENSQVLFVSHSTKEKTEAYKQQYNLDNISNIKFLQCNADDFYNLFKETSTPTYFIYNTEQELIKIINDDIPVRTILRYIKVAQIDA